MFKTITEGKAKIKVPKEEKITRKLPVFYNPVMELNRTISLLILKELGGREKIGLPLAGTGIRGIRFLLNNLGEVYFNDHKEEAVKLIKENLELNNIKKGFYLSCEDANEFLVENTGFDYIDIDPYGSPNFLLNNAIRGLARNGILSVTATDTGALAGSYVKACKRKYWAEPLKNEEMHENGLRILIRKVQLIGADHEKALTPIYSYFKDHYMKVIFLCEKGKQKCDTIIKQHGMYKKAGPLWKGKLWDKKLAEKIAFNKFTEIIKEEAKIDIVGFYHIPTLCKKNKLKMKKQIEIISLIKEKGYEVAETHFARNSIKSNIKEKELIQLLS